LLANRDATDFGSIYQRYAPDALRFTLYLCANRADAEDILSETFIRAWTSPAGIRVGTVKAYLLMIARLGSHDSETARARAFVAGAAWLIHVVSLPRARRNALRAATPRAD
jgi:DNA-directed RNA polymerase specialized sigma24 family protein